MTASPAGRRLWEELPWDSRHFGRRIGRLRPEAPAAEELRAAVEEADREGIDCLYWLAATGGDAGDGAAGTVARAEGLGFRFRDVRVTLDLRLEERSWVGKRWPGRQAREGDLGALRAVAAASFRGSRFFADPGFARTRCEALYEVWIERSVRDPEVEVLVVERGGEAAGFVTCERTGGPGPGATGKIGLLAVAEPHRGAGLGRVLVEGALGRFADRGAAAVTVVTQGGNVAAQRLYQAAGFRTTRVDLWLHRWRVPQPSFRPTQLFSSPSPTASEEGP